MMKTRRLSVVFYLLFKKQIYSILTFFEIDFYIYLYCQFYIVFRKNKFIMLPTLKYFMAILTLPNSLTIYLFNMCTVLS